jgi:hypothetical protein
MGEQLMLINSSGSTVQDITFGAQQPDKGYARQPNGTGSFVTKDPTFNANNDTGLSATHEEERAGALSIYPNPVGGGQVVLRSESAEKQEVAIYDQWGRQLFAKQFYHQTTVDASGWPAGVYFVKTATNTQRLDVQW